MVLHKDAVCISILYMYLCSSTHTAPPLFLCCILQVTMLTGDSPLTACHVAKELKICQNKQVILTLQDSALDTWAWQKVGGGQLFPLSDWVSLKSQYDLCLTGDVRNYSSVVSIHCTMTDYLTIKHISLTVR